MMNNATNNNLSPAGKLGAAILVLTDQKRGFAPYFRTMLALTVSRIESREVPTLGVSADWRMAWNPEFVAEISVPELVGVLYHECWHLRSAHHERAREIGLFWDGDGAPPDALARKFALANLAQDASINEVIVKIPGIKLPGNFVLPSTLPNFGPFSAQADNLAWEERFRILLDEDRQNQDKQKQQGGDEDGEGDGDGQGNGAGEPGVGHGGCGTCAVGGQKKGEEGKGRSKVEIERALRQTARDIKAHVQAKGAGNVPAELVRWADEVLAPAKVDWREVLGDAVKFAVHSRPGASAATFRKVNRRQGGIGFGVGAPIVPGVHRPIPRVGVIVDTSGSMSSSDLADAGSEVQGLLDEVNAKITVVGVDAAVADAVEASSIHEAVKAFKGGGGTNMQPGFDYLAAQPSPPEVVVCLTDGHFWGSFEDTYQFSTVWVLIGEHAGKACSWGEHLRLADFASGREAA